MRSDELSRATIAAIGTPPGKGGIGIVRVSGADVPTVAAAVLGRLPPARQATFATFRNSRAEPVDEGIALYFPAPHSYTGEPVLELQGHGGPMVMQALLSACLDAGARLAEPGEFTRRAFLEGKLDLAQAEAVADLIDAATTQAARCALRSLSGEFSSAVADLAGQLLELRALVEAMLDFPEEEVDAMHREDASTRLRQVRARLDDVLEKCRQGTLLRSGIHVVLAGRPNVGKSSLLNRLAGVERAIVTPVAGTTRDALREAIQIEGVPLVVVDTAGLREADNLVEQLGVQRTREEVRNADLVLVVHEAGAEELAAVEVPHDASRLDVYNKVDLAPNFVAPVGALAVSAKTGEGLDELRRKLVASAGWSGSGESVFLARERHLRALGEAGRFLAEAAQEIGRWELFADGLRLAHRALGEVTGEATADDVLGEIFARFCIGK